MTVSEGFGGLVNQLREAAEAFKGCVVFPDSGAPRIDVDHVLRAAADAIDALQARIDDKCSDVVLTIDPRRQFGRVCVNGTRTPADCLAGGAWSSDGVDGTADAYDVSRTAVLAACWWAVTSGEMTHLLSAKERRQNKDRCTKWSEWSVWAAHVLGGHVKDVELCDPDDYAGESLSEHRAAGVPEAINRMYERASEGAL